MFKNLVLFFIIFSVTPVYADFITATGLGPNYGMYQPRLNRITTNSYNKVAQRYHKHGQPCLNCNSAYYLPPQGLSALEKYSMNKTFKRENDLARLARLEELAFGAEQYGDLASRYKNVETAILSRPQYNSKRSILGSLANYFAGQATGFTPSLSSSDSFFYPSYNSNQGFNNQRYDQYSNGIFGGGYKFTDGGFGNQSVIRMLD